MSYLDLKITDGDAILSSSGKLVMVSGARAVAQTTERVIMAQKGSFFWKPEGGMGLIEALNGNEVDEEKIKSEAEEVLYNDERIDADTVKSSSKLSRDKDESILKLAVSFTSIEGEEELAVVEVSNG